MRLVCLLALLALLMLIPNGLLAQHKLTVNVDNTSTFIGRQLAIRVVDVATAAEVIRYTESAIQGIEYTRQLLGLVQGHSYTVDLYIDKNGDGDYDAPPVDAAWRLMVDGVTADAAVHFVALNNTTDIMFPRKPLVQPHYLTKTYVGSWNNLTYNTTGQATGTSTVNFEHGTADLSMTTNGAFGIPAPITMNFTGTINNTGDSADLTPVAPASGYLRFVRGRVYGVVTLQSPSVMLEILGYTGDQQIMFTYSMTGAYTANGIMTMTQGTATGITDFVMGYAVSATAQPNPTATSVLLRSNAPFTRVALYDVSGMLVRSVEVGETLEHMLDMRTLPRGVYMATMRGNATAGRIQIVVQ